MEKTIPELVELLKTKNLPVAEYHAHVDDLLNRLSPPQIFILTCLHLTEGEIDHQRTWGWFPDLSTAIEAATENDGDMYECGYYNAVVIEEVAWGSMAWTEKEHWFDVKAQPDDADQPIESYVVKPMEKPEPLRQTVHFCMG